jgi:hypothetical protein
MTPNPLAAAPAAASPTIQPEPSHACIRCGRPGVAPDKGLCEECNPLELAQPSATQVHGIAALGIVAFVAVLAVLGRFALAGTGPFTGSVVRVDPAAGGLAVTMSVHNGGSKNAATTCNLVRDTRPVGGVTELVQTPPISAGGDATFTSTVARFGSTPLGLVADCQSP